MANIVSKLGLRIVTLVVGIPLGIASKKLVEKIWTAARPDDPPRAPSDPDASWADALSWAALSAVGVALAQLLTGRAAASAWRSLTGAEPPAKKQSPAAAHPAAK